MIPTFNRARVYACLFVVVQEIIRLAILAVVDLDDCSPLSANTLKVAQSIDSPVKAITICRCWSDSLGGIPARLKGLGAIKAHHGTVI